MLLPSRIPVYEPDIDRILEFVSRACAEQMLRRRQARLEPGGRALRLIVYHDMPEHPCRTRVSRGGVLAACGMSQEYTLRNERGKVNGFKRIFPEDRHFFNLATEPGAEFSGVKKLEQPTDHLIK